MREPPPGPRSSPPDPLSDAVRSTLRDSSAGASPARMPVSSTTAAIYEKSSPIGRHRQVVSAAMADQPEKRFREREPAR